MKIRTPAILARLGLAFLTLSPFGLLALFHANTIVWPYGRIHNLGLVALTGASWVFACIVVVVSVVTLTYAVSIAIFYLSLVSLRRPHYRCRDYFRYGLDVPHLKKIHPKQPPPLIRGRTGSR